MNGRTQIPPTPELRSPSARRLRTALERFGSYWPDYDFSDFEDLRGLRDSLADLAFEAQSAITELEAMKE